MSSPRRERTAGASGRARSGSRRARELGQNFLVDRNLADLIVRLAELEPDDVVLEVGGGRGALSPRLAAGAAHLHVVELDERLERPLREALTPFSNATLHIADVLELELTALRPAPTKIVANLPYAIAATAILETIERLPGVGRWLVMVQREVGDRLAAAPGSGAYGAPSVLAQLACEVRVLRAVPPTVFRPVPRVESALVALRRLRPAADPGLRRLVRDAFAHRRKPLAGSLALADGAAPDVRERARAALVALGHPADERAERLSAEEFRRLARMLG